MSTAGADRVSPTATPTTGPAAASRPWVAGLALFAGVVMIAVGLVAALNGIAALIGDPIYVTVAGYLLFLPYAPWWSLLIIALYVAVIGALSVYRPDEAFR